jgi:hypothetical protein
MQSTTKRIIGRRRRRRIRHLTVCLHQEGTRQRDKGDHVQRLCVLWFSIAFTHTHTHTYIHKYIHIRIHVHYIRTYKLFSLYGASVWNLAYRTTSPACPCSIKVTWLNTVFVVQKINSYMCLGFILYFQQSSIEGRQKTLIALTIED